MSGVEMDVVMPPAEEDEPHHEPSTNDKLQDAMEEMRQDKKIEEEIQEMEEAEINAPEIEEEEPPLPIVKPIVPDEAIFKDPPVRKKGQRRGPMTEKQKAHLAKARAKGLEVRRAKKKIKDEERAKLQEAKQVQETKKVSFEKKIQNYPTLNHMSEEQIIKLQEEAIGNYEKRRKAEKKIKREEQAKEAQEKKAFNVISRAVNASDPMEDFFGQCFE
jgi:hypothetical protein